MKPQIGPPELARDLRAVAADHAASSRARADAVALLLGDVERMAGKRSAAAAARAVLGRIAAGARSAAAGLRKFITRSNPPRIKAWKPPLLPGAPELQLVRVAPGRKSKNPIAGPGDIAQALAFITLSHREAVWIALFDSKHRINGIYKHTLGTHASSAVYPSEILRVVLYSGLEKFAMIHNHPSGDPTPSADDLSITQRVIEGCHLLGNIRMLDSIVVAHHSDDRLKVGHRLAYQLASMPDDSLAQFAGVAEDGPRDIAVRYTSIFETYNLRP